MDFKWIVVFCMSVAVLAGAVALYLAKWVEDRPCKNAEIIRVGKLIADGAKTFLRREYGVLLKFALACAAIIFLLLPTPIYNGQLGQRTVIALCYLCGTALSAAAGKIGIMVATNANQKCAVACKHGVKPAFMVGFRGGAVMGLLVVGFSLFGVLGAFVLTGNTMALLAFSFGASSLALFAKAGGGIFTKTADISADLVGKVELGIEEDDPRNHAVIADNVGDNVGDVAGMGADLFDSNVAAIVSAVVLASALKQSKMLIGVVFFYAGLGLLCSIIGIMCAKIGKKTGPSGALNTSTYLTTGLFLVATALVSAFLPGFSFRIWGASVVGLLAGVVIGICTDYFTGDNHPIVKKVANACKSGPAFTMLSGMSYGFVSALPAMVGIGFASLISYKLCAPLGEGYALFGIAMAAVGMLSIVGMVVSNDAFGPIVDNARGLCQMGGLGEESLKISDELDSAGNTVKAITKGFAIGAAGLTVISLLGAYITDVNVKAQALGMDLLKGFDVLNPTVFFGVLAGAAVPAVFCALLMLGVDRNARRMVGEIHRQFEEIPGLKEGKSDAHPQYDRCIIIATDGALKELLKAGGFAIVSTLVVGFIGGVNAVGGFLFGNIVSGLLLALFMSNAGGLWDNTKKYIEAGHMGGSGSQAHKAAVVGDTVGDPFKDTAGPSINTQITVVSLVASLMSGLFLSLSIFG